MIELAAVIRCLDDAGVKFIIIGGLACAIHGSARITHDVDVVYRRTPENIVRLSVALRDQEPYLRGAPPGLPFRFDVDTIKRVSISRCRPASVRSTFWVK